MLFLKKGNLKNDNLLFQVKVMFFTAQVILQPTAGNTPPPPALEIRLRLWEQNLNSRVLDFCNGNNIKQKDSQWIKRATCEGIGEAVYLVKSIKQEKRLETGGEKQFFKAPFLLPDIGVRCEDSIFQWFWGHPADRQQTFPSFTVIICLVDISCHAKI